MKPTITQCNAFLAQELLPSATFRHNEHVRIISGMHEGLAGHLVSVLELDEDPILLIELESGFDATVRQSEIARW